MFKYVYIFLYKICIYFIYIFSEYELNNVDYSNSIKNNML